jgi:hypothetical protein
MEIFFCSEIKGKHKCDVKQKKMKVICPSSYSLYNLLAEVSVDRTIIVRTFLPRK